MGQALTQVAAKIEQPVTDMRAGLYQSGVQAFQAGRWETAIEQFSRLLTIDPSYEDASRWLDNTRKAQSYSQQSLSRAVGGGTKGQRGSCAQASCGAALPEVQQGGAARLDRLPPTAGRR